MFVAFLTALVGLAGAIIFGAIGWLALCAWLLSGLVTLSLLATFTSIDNGRRASLFYSVSTFALVLYWATLAVAFAGIIISAWHIADWIGRL